MRSALFSRSKLWYTGTNKMCIPAVFYSIPPQRGRYTKQKDEQFYEIDALHWEPNQKSRAQLDDPWV